MDLSSELFIRGTGYNALLIQQRQHASMLTINEIKDVLIVRKSNPLPTNAFPLVLFLFKLEDILVELLLQLSSGGGKDVRILLVE